jgi:hypothetical protein
VDDLDTIPLADEVDQPNDHQTASLTSRSTGERSEAAGRPRWRLEPIAAPLIIVGVCVAHGLAIWVGLGGWAGLNNGWPLWRDDHPLYYHSSLVTRAFLNSSGTTAGYDPSFMSGYAKSVVFPASSTLPELVIWAFGGERPELAYKLYVFVAAAAVPWLLVLACASWRLSQRAMAAGVILQITYVWADFPINYVGFGMLPYFLGIPLGLLATGLFGRYLEAGGFLRWLAAALVLSLAFLVHLTVAMIVVPAAILGYAVASWPRPGQRFRPGRRIRWGTHLAIWLIPAIVLAVNAFWWLPGVWLRATKGASDFAFAHPEGVGQRLKQILYMESPAQCVLLAAGVPGLALLVRGRSSAGWTLVGFCAAGFGWGYMAGGFRDLDFLQPGRHTYALYTAMAVGGGATIDEVCRRARAGSTAGDRFDLWLVSGMILIAARMVGAPLVDSVRNRLVAGEPFLSSQPSPRLSWVVDRVKRHVSPGERLLYEEGGFGIPGLRDPFQGGRFSGLLPELTGVELLGGPYLHASLKTNFTQFGENKLFGKTGWDVKHFRQYAALYRPSAILCWTPHSRRFCRDHPDLIQILDDEGTLLIGRVLGFGGGAIEGSAVVEAAADRIRVREMSPGLDGTIVLRYHSVPYLSTTPEVACEPVQQEGDPVPFIRLRPPPGLREVDIKARFPGWRR